MRVFESDGYFEPSRGSPIYYIHDDHEGRMDGSRSFDRLPLGCKPWAMQQIVQPHHNDVLMGRGGKNNQHSGNERLRQLARRYCDQYRVSKKKGKSNISRELVRMVRNLDPPGRFLRKDPTSRLWEDVGDDTAREKASQVLRDAVALVHPEDSESNEQQVSIVGVPSLDETAASSTEELHGMGTEICPPPTPLQSRLKRARVSQSWEDSANPRSAPVQPSFTHSRNIAAASNSIARPPALLSLDRRSSSTATVGSLLGDLHAEIHSTLHSEFDLFDGQLLDAGDASSVFGSRNVP